VAEHGYVTLGWCSLGRDLASGIGRRVNAHVFWKILPVMRRGDRLSPFIICQTANSDTRS
jgi:hypothetical protein